MVQAEQLLLQLMSRELAALTPKDRQLIVSVSGGRDSMCLLHSLFRLQKQFELRVIVFHVNFGLRGRESDRDQEFVQNICRDLDVPCFVHRVPRATKLSQERAREIRLQAAKPLLPNALLLEAHHADDQVETFFFRLFRGTGLTGLNGMKRFSIRKGRRVYRPFLRLRRSQIDAYIKSEKLKYRDDRTNAEDIYSRNWIRNKLSSKIEEKFGHYRESILRLQDQIQEEDEYFDNECRLLAEKIVSADLDLDLSRLRATPKAVLRRFLHHFFREYFSLSLDRTQILELSQLILWERPFTWNAPQNWVVRGGRDGILRCIKAPGREHPVKKQAKG